MAIAFAPPRTIRCADVVGRSRVMTASAPRSARAGLVMRFATGSVLAYCSVFPIVQVALIAESWDGGYHRAAWALAATAIYLPLHLRHVLYAVRGGRAPYAWATVLVMAAVIVGVLPLAGSFWLLSMHAIAVSALIALRPRWSLPIVAAVVIAQTPLALAVHSSAVDSTTYYTLSVLWRTSVVFVPVWLLGTVRQLDAARQALARDAVLRERLSIDGELRRTLGIALAGITARGERAGSLTERSAVDDALRDLVASSRRTLGDARQLIRSYHRPSVRGELSTAAALLTAAGIRTRVVLPPDEPPGADFREQLRAATAELLRDGTVRSCVLAVDAAGRLDVSRGAELATVADD